MTAVRSILKCPGIAIAACAIFVAAPVQAASYAVTDLGLRAGYYSQAGAVEAYGLGPQGQVIGLQRSADGQFDAYVSGPNGSNPVAITSGYSSAAYGINSQGLVTGDGFLYDSTTQSAIALPSLGGSRSVGHAVNASGQVAGTSALPADPDTGYTTHHAYVSGPNGGPLTDLGSLGGHSSAQDLNDAGQVVGVSELADGVTSRAFVATAGGGMRDLGTLYEGNLGMSYAYAINNAGFIVGMASSIRGDQAFITQADGQGLTALLSVGLESYAADINNLGQVVGRYLDVDGIDHAFYWQDGTFVDLTQAEGVAGSGWVLGGAQAINDRGQIVGWGMFNGEHHTYLLTPVPEPATWTLTSLGLGIAGTVARSRRKR